ncbi:hypothetical protein [Planctomonas psychrotolerans]|uniref:hypothetical protein n=1 Tax=Planctomonas psychrotolerans TaxID=2528712 RepID=UPI001D0D1ED8|nr:hypothetical protein [Planctomonas psychrotolerans]
MTAVTGLPVTPSPSRAPARLSKGHPMSRVWNVVRLHLTNTWAMLVTPGIILGVIFLANLAIWVIITRAAGADAPEAIEGTQYSGAALFIFVYMMVVAVQAITVTFPFALGYSVTRRDYYLGTSLLFVLLALAWSIVLAALSLLEEATNGWGLGGHMFTSIYFGNGEVAPRLWIPFAGLLFFFFIGAAVATIYMRWRMNGMIVFWVVSLILVVGLAALVTYTDSWPAVGNWFSTNGVVGVASWSLVPTAVAAVTGFFVLRRATPKN